MDKQPIQVEEKFFPVWIAFLLIVFLVTSGRLSAGCLAEEFREKGYLEICGKKDEIKAFDALYARFDELIEFLQSHPIWAQRLYGAKERFIRSKDREDYSTEVFGFFDESTRKERSQIAFYYSTHFHEFIRSQYKDLNQVPEIVGFLNACCEIQKPYGELFREAARELNLEKIFSSKNGQPSLLLKIVKYFPSYSVSRPHYDGAAFSLFLDSTDNESLLLSPYKAFLAVDDFSSPLREDGRSSILLIPGTHVAEFSIFPTPHIVIPSGKIRHATIAFAMRPNYSHKRIEFSSLPSFKGE